MPESTAVEPIGRRIARLRKARGLTQNGLAQATSYSRSLISLVESGSRMPTPALIGAVARALHVDAAEVHGQPYRLEGHDDHVHHAIPALRRVLLTAGLGAPGAEPRPLDVLDADIARVRALMHDGALVRAADPLPEVLHEAATRAYGDDTPQAWAVYARGLYAAGSLTRRLGYTGDTIAFCAAQEAAATRAQDPNLPWLATYLRTLVQITAGEHAAAQTACDRAMAAVDQEHRGGRELYGGFALRSSIAAARRDAGAATTDAWDRWASAAEYVRAEPIVDVHGIQSTPQNAAIHGAAVAVELGDADEAVRRDERIGDQTLAALPAERRVHHQLDMARALTEVGAYDLALNRVTQAYATAAQMVRYHPTARHVVHHLVEVRRTLPEPLRRLNAVMGA